jgi:hypothetical protein
LLVAREIRGNGGRPSGKRPARTPDLKLTIRKKRRRDPHTAPHVASRTERRRPQRQQRRDPGLRLGHLRRRPAARGGAARVALDLSASVARGPASHPGRTPPWYLQADHRPDHQGGALACDRKFRRRIHSGCRSNRADRRAAAASRAGSGRARPTAQPIARAGVRRDAQRRQARLRSQHAAGAARDSGSSPVHRHSAGHDQPDSCPAVRGTVSISIREC